MAAIKRTMTGRAAAIQMASSPSVSTNLGEAERLIRLAAANGANLVVLPENFALMGRTDADKLAIKEADGAGPIQDFLARQAREHKLWLVGGTIPLAARDATRVRASCLVYDPAGRRVARYDKMHLFDVRLTENNEVYNESQTIEAGDQVCVVDTPFGRLGVGICYDLRFPELFRRMLDDGMEVLAMPAAFTALTGRAHWEALIRARAIENLCYVIAAAQGGYHLSGRETWGDSMIVDPWGAVRGRQAQGAGVVCVDIDRALLDGVRRNFPALDHRRLHLGRNKSG